MFHLDVPESAIATFETLHDLRVTVHDFRGSLWPFLPPDRFFHAQSPCVAVKLAGRERACFAFDVERLRREMALYPDGAAKICHAGFLEWVVPIFHGQALEWLLFAGLRRAAPTIQISLRQPITFFEAGNLAPVDEINSQLVSEHLRQLGARLRLWALDNEENAPRGPKTPPLDEFSRRAITIRRFIAQNHARALRLGELAARLGLSEGRTGHLVRECCGQTFGALLLEARLRTAMGLLRHGELGIGEVARRSGFEDTRGFGRVFRREIGTTPSLYRRNSRA